VRELVLSMTDISHQKPADLELMASVLETTGDYRVLRRLRSGIVETASTESMRRGVFVDVETTGLNAMKDEIIELAMLPFRYDRNDRVVAVDSPFVAYRDPGMPIPTAVINLTGITDAKVAGAMIDPDEVARFVNDAVLIVAHNSGFDRPFCERAWPLFATKPWACTLREIAWADEGFEGAKLCHLAAGFGFFFDGHHAADDCRAGVEILRATLPRSRRGVLSAMLESARMPRWRIWATAAPFNAREALKLRGYRWNAGEDGRPRAWHVDVADDARDSELEYLRRQVYGTDDVCIPCSRITAFERYSARC
jgi:DNA polymerase-3 subunit epsilon